MTYAGATNSSAINTSDARNLELLKLKRDNFREHIFSLETFVLGYKETPRNRLILQEKLNRLKNCPNDFCEVQDEITMIDENEETQRAEILEDYDNAVASAKLRLGVETNVPKTVTAGSQTSPALTFNLPKIELPKFDGRMEKWMAFKDAFIFMVHNEAGLNNAQKLAHLRRSLVGEAETILDGFLTTEENYERAWQHLLENYDNKRWLVIHHVANILKTPEMSDETADSFKRTLGHIQRHVRWLQAIGRTAQDIGNDLLIGVLSAKMTPEAHRAWEMSLTDTEVPRVEHLYKHMRLASHPTGELIDDHDDVSPEAQLPAAQTAAAATTAPATVATDSQTSSALAFNLPKFDGRMEKWIAFKDAFTSMVHNEAGLNNVQKFAHLRRSLVGEAEKVLDGFLTTEENYERAWQHLLESYDNKRWLVMHYVANILKTPEMRDETADSFKRTLGHIQQHVRWLQAIGRTAEDIGNDLLIGILSEKMTPEARRAWKASLTDTEMPRVEHLYKHMRLASLQTNELIDDSGRDKNNAMKETSAKPAPKETSAEPATKETSEKPAPKEASAKPATKEASAKPTTPQQQCMYCYEYGHTNWSCPRRYRYM